MAANRTWIKIFCSPWLRGAIREESCEVRALWIDLLALAGDGSFGDEGKIKLADMIGLTDQQIAGVMKVDIATWQQVKSRLVETERITVDDNNIITVTNWAKYQSEYSRQKQYREKLQPKVTSESYNQELQAKVHREGEGEGEGEGEENKSTALAELSELPSSQFLEFHLPSQEEIEQSSEKKLEDNLNDVAERLYRENIFPKVHSFTNAMLKKHKNPRALIHALGRCYLKRPPQEEAWGYCVQILKVEDGNYNERDHRKIV